MMGLISGIGPADFARINMLRVPITARPNLADLSGEMTTKVAQLKNILPAGITIKPYYVQADFVNESVKSVRDSLLIGLALFQYSTCQHHYNP